MGRKKIPGLQKRYGVWRIDKKVFGQRVCESTGTGNLEEAEKYLVRRIEQIREALVYGVRPKRTFREAATRYLKENMHKASINNNALQINLLDYFIGSLTLKQIHSGSLQPFIAARQKIGRKNKTINLALGVVRHILNLASSEWLDENGLTWLDHAPKIKLLSTKDSRKPYPLSWEEQDKLFAELPQHLKQMSLFAVNTGCRDREICSLKWEWEVDLHFTSIFAIPGQYVKNGEDRLIVLNNVAKSVIESVRSKHETYVFTYKNKPTARMLNSAWKKARIRADLTQVRVHDLKHTFGRRLRSAGVSFEDRQDLLGHKSGRITTHYSSAELESLIAAANKACDREKCGTIINMFKNDNQRSREYHAQQLWVVK
jgi:integrase